jgi:Fe-S-cluster-containing hydrogenase component 2
MVECDQDKCMFCGGCVAVCPKDAIVVYESRTVVDEALCSDCGNCTSVCPVGAMSIP